MSGRVFVSYSHAGPGKILAKKLHDAIEARGYSVYIDLENQVGENWAKAVDEALRNCEVLLVLLSKTSIQSEAVMAEVRTAKQLADKNNGTPRILPIRIAISFDEPLPYEMNIAVGRLQHAYWDGESAPDALIDDVVNSLKTGNFKGTVPETGKVCSRIDSFGNTKTKRAQIVSPASAVDPSSINTLNITAEKINIDDSLYVIRECDRKILSLIKQERALIRVVAPGKMGKTSLLMRVAHKAHEQNIRVAFIDFLSFSPGSFNSVNNLWKAIAKRLERALDLPRFVKDNWDDEEETYLNLEDFAKATKLDASEVPSLISIDNIDRVFNTASGEGFFSMVRSIHAKSAQNPCWKKIRWLLVSSVDPELYVRDPYESLLNIGTRVELRDFNKAEVVKLAKKYRVEVNEEDIALLHYFLNGHPYLTQLALFYEAQGKATLSEIVETGIDENMIFREHLNNLHLHFVNDKAMLDGLQLLILGKQVVDLKVLARLQALGLIRFNGEKYVVRCRLYEEYFGKKSETKSSTPSQLFKGARRQIENVQQPVFLRKNRLKPFTIGKSFCERLETALKLF